MNDQSILKGVVSAYNAVTKETIFSGLHNVVTVRSKLWALMQVANLAGISASDIFIDAQAYNSDTTSSNRKTNLTDAAAAGPIAKFRVGRQLDKSFPPEYEDATGFFSDKLYDIAWFTAEDNYDVSDITGDMKNKKLIYSVSNGAFVRFKLRLYGGANSSGHNGLGVAAGSSQDINLIGLANANGRLFTQFRFPAITFYTDTQVDFEYRLYL